MKGGDVMAHRIPEVLRRQWISLVNGAGAAMGLSDCQPFLEGKYVNDIFFAGQFKGRPCVVKCSTKAPDSIENEYEINRRLHEVDPGVFPEPFAVYRGPMAFVATEKLAKPERLVSPVDDIMRMARALEKTGIVHRDVQLNLLPGGDGHLRLIDFQFAIDRNAYRESDFMMTHWKYLYTVFGVHRQLGIGRWCDVTSFIAVLERNRYDGWEAAVKALRAKEGDLEFSVSISQRLRAKFWVYAASLWIQAHLGWNSCKRRIQSERLAIIKPMLWRGRR